MKPKNLRPLMAVDPAPQGEPEGGGTATIDPPVTEDTPPADGGDDKARLQAALNKERAMRREVERRLKEHDPAAIEAARRQAEEAERQRQETESKASQRLREAEQRSADLIKQIQAAADEKVLQAERAVLKLNAQADFYAADGLQDASEIDGTTHFDSIWGTHGHLVDRDESGAYIKGPDGLPKVNQETGKRVTLKEFFSQLREDRVHGAHFKPRYGTGGGSTSGYTGRAAAGRDISAMGSRDLLAEGLREAREHVRRTA
jgi:hypothetical protein